MKIIALTLSTILCLAVIPQSFSQDMDIPSSLNVMADKDFVALKDSYRSCTFNNAKEYLEVSGDIELTIKYSQIACKRDLLKMKQFLINGAFKVEVIDSLIDSIKQGIEIDLVVHVFELAKGLKSGAKGSP